MSTGEHVILWHGLTAEPYTSSRRGLIPLCKNGVILPPHTSLGPGPGQDFP